MKHLRSLDGVRGLAIAMILFWHYFAWPLPGFHPWLRWAWTGVDLFFVLSGFLIGGIILDGTTLQSFYIRRTTRIFPLYFVWLSVTLLLLWLVPAMRVDRLPTWPYFVYAQNFWMAARNTLGGYSSGGTWSLAIEEQFYLTLPWLIRWTPREKLKWVVAGGIVAAPCLRVALYFLFPHNRQATFVLMPCRMDSLLIGVGAAILYRNRPEWLTTRRLHVWIAVLLAGAVGLVWWGIFPGYFQMVAGGMTWIALLYGAVVLEVSLRPWGRLAKAFSFRPLRRLGSIAYGVYLFHEIVLALVWLGLFQELPSTIDELRWVASVLAVPFTLILCWLSWERFEKPIVEWGRRYGDNEKGSAR